MARRVTPRSLMIPGSVIALWIVLIGLGPSLMSGRIPVPVWYLALTAIFVMRPIFYPLVFRQQYVSTEAECERLPRSSLASRVAFMVVSIALAVIAMPRPAGGGGAVADAFLTPAFWVAMGVSLLHCIASPVIWPLALWWSRKKGHAHH
ncbi:hypothetical protein [Streptomyces sp. NPDC059015]|uniref:hypothetical protein n=1 Tax=unclassified Streptomyces TaxID=2593676 RepID=UPI0036B83E0E